MAVSTGAAILGGAALSAGGSMLASKKAAGAQEAAAGKANALQRYMYDQNRTDLAPYRETGGAALNQLAALYGLPQFNQEDYEREQTLDARRDKLHGKMWGSNKDKLASLGYVTRTADVDYSELDPALFDQFRGKKQRHLTELASIDKELAGLRATPEPGTQGPDFSQFYQSPDYQFALEEGNKALDRSAASRGRLFSGAQMKGLSRYNQGMASQQFNNYANRLASIAGIGQTATNTTAGLGANYAANAGNALQNAGAARASGYAGMANALNSGINNGLYMYGMSGGFGGGAPTNEYGTGYGAVGAFG